MIPEQLRAAATSLLENAGVKKPSFDPLLLPGGANNKVFRLDVPEEGSFLLKVYFRHQGDSRDRLKTEFSFMRFAWENGVRSVPQPIACDVENQVGLYEFVMGHRVESARITHEMIEQAVTFYHDLNRHRHLPDAHKLPVASEACFSVADHLRCVDRRLSVLQNLEISSPVRQEVTSFVRGELMETWDRTREFVLSCARELDLSIERRLTPAERRLSPSDFGFHNALVQDNGQVRFIDFEYAGWDDPGKLASDFFCLKGVPVPDRYYDFFVEAIVRDGSEPNRQRDRIQFLCAVHRMKWCCILLNDFLPVGSERRRFSDNGAQRTQRERIQLRKAHAALKEARELLPKTALVSGPGK